MNKEACPFCGSFEVEIFSTMGGVMPTCKGCGATGPTAKDEASAYRKWNFRPSPDYNSAAS